MFKKVLFAAALVMASSPAFVTAQDIFFSFDEFSRVPTATLDSDVTDTGSVFIFADENFDFNEIDLGFTTSNADVAAFTGGQTFNSDGSFTPLVLLDQTPTDGRLIGVSVGSPGIDPANSGTDVDFRAGANGFLLAQLDYDLGGGGAANFDFNLGDLGITNDGIGEVIPTFGSGALTVLGEPAPPFVPPVEPPVVPPASPAGDPSLFISFDENSRVDTPFFAPGTTSGTAYIFADENLEFDSLDLDFSVDGVASITSATTFNAGGKFVAFLAVDPNDPSSGPTATDGRLFAASLAFSPGQIPGSNDADFRPGANGFVLASVDFDLAGEGTANFDLVLGDLGVADAILGPQTVTLQGGTLTVGENPAAVPEPSSATLLILGAAAMVARRRRS